MSGFEEREKAHENKYAYDEEMKFKIASRRRKLLGLWAADKMSMSDAESLHYAMEIVSLGIMDKTPQAVINKIAADFKRNEIALTESDVRKMNNEFEVVATRQLTENQSFLLIFCEK